MSEGNNGYIRSAVMAEQGELLPTGIQDGSPSEASLQVGKKLIFNKKLYFALHRSGGEIHFL